MANPFDTLRRRNYEAYAALTWLLSGSCALMGIKLTILPPEPYWFIFLLSIVMLCIRGIPAVAFHIQRKNLKPCGKVDYLDIGKLDKLIRKRIGNIYLGKGFDWKQPHTQKVFDILKGDIENLVPRSADQMGSYWVHGLHGGKDKEILLPIKHSEGHTLIVGTTGAGKTTLFQLLIAQAILRDEAVLIFDPKGDQGMLTIAKDCCRYIGKPERFVYFNPAFPEQSSGLDPLHNYNRASELASRLAALIPSETGSDPFKAFGQKSLDNIVQAILTIESRPSLLSLRRYLEAGSAGLLIKTLGSHFDKVTPEWKDHIDLNKNMDSVASRMIQFYRYRVQEHSPALALEGLLSLYEHDRTHFNKMVASLLPIMNMLTTGDLAYLLSPGIREDMRHTNLAQIIQQNQVAYIALDSLSDAMTGAAIGSLLLSDLASVAGDRYNYGIGNQIINIFVDEAAEVVNDPFIQVLNKGRGAGMRLFVATQTFPDFAARLGNRDKALQTVGNMNNLITLRVLDPDTQKYVTANLPKTYIKYIMPVQGSNTNADDPLIFSGSVSERLMEEEVDMVPPQLLGMLPNFHYFAKVSGNRIIKGRLPVLVSDKSKKNPH